MPMTVGEQVLSAASLKRKVQESGHGLPGLPEDPFRTARTEHYRGLPQKVWLRLWLRWGRQNLADTG